MAAIHGKLGRVKITASVATTSTDMASDLQTDKRTLLIDQSTRRHWAQPSTMPRVYGATTNTELTDAYQIDYVRGRVTFSTDHSTSVAYKVDAAWYPASNLGMTRNWTLDVQQTLHDVTCFSTSVAWRSFAPGLGEATITLGRLFGSSESTGPPFADRQAVQAPVYVELFPNATEASKFECYAYIQGRGNQVTPDDMTQETVTLKASGPIYFTTST